MEKGRQYARKWIDDYDFKTFVNSFGSTLITFAFAVFNCILGFNGHSSWYICVAVYYAALAGIRSFIILKGRSQEGAGASLTYRLGSGLLLLVGICLVIPIAILVKAERPQSITMGFIPSITMAAYTTFKVTLAAINLRRKGKQSENQFVKLLRTINFIDALYSIVVLQNTLIMANTTDGGASMMPLAAATSAAIWAAILAISVFTFAKSFRRIT